MRGDLWEILYNVAYVMFE